MFSLKLTPRFQDTDALGHINNASILTWFETARRPIFEMFIPDLDPKKWCLIVARVEVDFLGQVHYQSDVEIKTAMSKLGNSSMQVNQQVWQNGEKVAEGNCVMVHFDYTKNKSQKIPDEIRSQLSSHVISDS